MPRSESNTHASHRCISSDGSSANDAAMSESNTVMHFVSFRRAMRSRARAAISLLDMLVSCAPLLRRDSCASREVRSNAAYANPALYRCPAASASSAGRMMRRRRTVLRVVRMM